ncbi:Arginine/ornithine antiporter ArcD [hydrothermal vent metagenome]|uniref:Arginine/ornithine antiporter ArcD n=1 Tax=hydrothermal vent metagenome TaxID=652676 RepID=A0A1W1ECC2_9ZZZZ
MKKQYFILVVIAYAIAIMYLAVTTPITPHEAKTLYSGNNIVSYFMQLGQSFVPGFLGMRIFFILFGSLSILFFYEFSKMYFSKMQDAYLSTFIFMILPGIITGVTLANISIIALPLVLLFVLLYEKNHFLLLPFIMLALFLIQDESVIFFIALFFYGVSHNDKKLFLTSGGFLLAFIYMAKGIEIGGIPSGHFIEIFGLYAVVLSPLVFLYFFYTMYRILLREKKTLLWYISFTALAFSLLLSIRQRIDIADFAPYVTIAIVLMIDIFNRSIRVRLPVFQKRYKLGFNLVIGSLIISALIIVFHYSIFKILKEPNEKFKDNVYKPYYLAKELKSKDITCYNVTNIHEQYQLQYYNISKCDY